jgi:ABC-type multidrug transport system ATPase subunit
LFVQFVTFFFFKVEVDQMTDIMKKYAGYVTQDDYLLPHLTVRQTLKYTALLKLPNTLTEQQKMDKVCPISCAQVSFSTARLKV